MKTGAIDTIRLALPSKGNLYDGIIELLEDGRIPRPSSQRPPVRSDDRRPRPLPRRLHEARRHRHPGAGGPMPAWA